MCAITHDRYFLDNVARWILEVDNGKVFPFSGNYSAWLASKHQRVDNEKKKTEARDRVIERELEWIKKNSGRGAITKGMRALTQMGGDIISCRMPFVSEMNSHETDIENPQCDKRRDAQFHFLRGAEMRL